MRWILVVICLASPALAQQKQAPPDVIQMHGELTALLADVVAVEAQIQNLQGDFRTMKAINVRLTAMRRRLKRLTRPRVVRPVLPAPSAPPAQPTPMRGRDFGELLSAVQKESFATGKLSVVTAAAKSNFFTVAQVIQLLQQLSFAKDKLKCVGAVKGAIVDMNNAYKLYDAFGFSGDKRKLKGLLGR